MSSPDHDLIIKNVCVVRPYGNVVHESDIAIKGDGVAKVAPGIDVTRAKAVYDERGRLAFPGLVDAHMHSGIYSPHYFGNIWMAKSGFGGTEYLLPSLVSECTKGGMDYNHMARVTSWNPAQRYGLNHKGDIAEGFDADIAIVDPVKTWQIAAGLPSAQGYTPFEGLELSARVDATFLRGNKIFEDGQVLGKPRGKYLHRPTA